MQALLGGGTSESEAPAVVASAPGASTAATSAAAFAQADIALSSGAMPMQAVLRYPLRAVETEPSDFAAAGLFDSVHIAITDDGAGVAEALALRFTERGLRAEIYDTEIPKDCDALIFLGGLREIDEAQAVQVNREAFAAAHSVAARFAERGGCFISVQDTGGDFGLSGSTRAWLAGLSGLAKTAAQEWPDATVRAIDIERAGRSATEIADALVGELTRGGNDLEIGLTRDGRRFALQSYAETALDASSVVYPDSVILVSGGARGVTAASLIALAKASACRFILLGRSELFVESEDSRGILGDGELKRALLGAAQARGEKISPAELGSAVARILANREISATLDAIRVAGGEARYVSVDVQDAAALARGIDPIRAQWGPITGVVHGAGVLADKWIAEKSPEQFDRVFDTKVHGLRALLEVTSEDPLSFLAFFSSVAARCGNQGQCDYAMANEILNKVAAAERALRGDGMIVKSFNWGPWEGGMVTPALKARFEALGVPLIPLATGAKMFVDELTVAARNQVEIVFGGEPKPDALLAEGVRRVVRYDKIVDREHYPYIDGHRVQGEAVVPVVLVLEWFARATRAMLPHLRCVGFSEVRVLRGIRLPSYDTDKTSDKFRIEVELLTNGNGATCRAEIFGVDGAKRYSAAVTLAENRIAADTPIPTLAELAPWPGSAYGGSLFHGAAFQVIREIEGISTEGARAEIVGAHEMKWAGTGWQMDPALLDGGLQLALLWTEHMTGGHSLPTAIEAVQIHRGGLPSEAVWCVVEGREAKADKCVSDIYFIDGNDVLIAQLRGVETVVLPGTRPADFVRPNPS